MNPYDGVKYADHNEMLSNLKSTNMWSVHAGEVDSASETPEIFNVDVP